MPMTPTMVLSMISRILQSIVYTSMCILPCNRLHDLKCDEVTTVTFSASI